jgi:hypothetical protein
MKIRAGWKPGMERRAAGEEGRQVKCLIASEGHLWMRGYYDRLPRLVRRRLTESPFNICPACLTEEARRLRLAKRSRSRTQTFFDAINAIERQLRGS